MGPCQIYSVTLIYLQGEAEIQTVKKKQVPQAGSVKKKVVVFFFSLQILLFTVQKGMWRIVFTAINGYISEHCNSGTFYNLDFLSVSLSFLP